MSNLDPLPPEFATPEEAEAHDAWFRAKVEASLADTRPAVPHEEAVARLDAIIARHRDKAK
jgi:hypothetical protein